MDQYRRQLLSTRPSVTDVESELDFDVNEVLVLVSLMKPVGDSKLRTR